MTAETANLDAVAWLALGMAVANRAFARKLTRDVGSRPFKLDSAMEEVYGMVEVIADIEGQLPMHQRTMIAQLLGIPTINGEKLSDAIVNLLAKEDSDLWQHRDNELMKLAKFVGQATTRMKLIATRSVKDKP